MSTASRKYDVTWYDSELLKTVAHLETSVLADLWCAKFGKELVSSEEAINDDADTHGFYKAVTTRLLQERRLQKQAAFGLGVVSFVFKEKKGSLNICSMD